MLVIYHRLVETCLDRVCSVDLGHIRFVSVYCYTLSNELKTFRICWKTTENAYLNLLHLVCAVYVLFPDVTEPILRVNQSVSTPPASSVCQTVAVRPPQHQHSLPSSHNTLPVSAAQLSQWGKSCQVLQARVFRVWQHVSLSVCPQTVFQFRNVVPACYRSTKSLLFVHIRQDQILSSLCRVPFCFRARFVSALSAFSSAGLCCCCCTVHHNTELQVDQKPLQHKTDISFFFFYASHPIRAAELKCGAGAEERA